MLAVGVAAPLVSSAGFQSGPTQGPTFRADVSYVEVDAIVTDREGNFVRDLTKDDFQVVEDGKPQTVTAFSLVDVPFEPMPRLPAAGPLVEPDVGTNIRPFEGRLYVMVLDDWHISPQRTKRVQVAALQFIDKSLGANDLMAVVYTSHTDRGQEFTNRRALLRASVERLMGDSLQSSALALKDDADGAAGIRAPADPFGEERPVHALATLVTLKKVSDSLGAVSSRRKAILLLGEGIDVDIMEPRRPQLVAATRDILASAARSNVSIYGIHALGLTGLADEGIENGTRISAMDGQAGTSQDNLHVLSDNTGGFAVINQNDFTAAYARVVRDSSSYYLLAYNPPDNQREGAFHAIDVRVTRPGLTVRARKGYASPRPAARDAKSNAGRGASAALSEALGGALQMSGLPLQVFAVPFRKSSREASVLLGIEVAGRGLKLGTNETLELSYVAVDVLGKVRASDSSTLTLNGIRPDTRDRIAQTGLRTLNRLDLPPGRYQVRVAAYETAGGARGSVFYDLDVPDFSRIPLAVSGMTLTSMVAARQPTPLFEEQFKSLLRSVLPAPPGALRAFSQNDEVAVFAEAYVTGNLRPATLTLTTTVTSEDGTVVLEIDRDRPLDHDRCALTARLPVKDFAPGTYVLEMGVAAPSTPRAVVSRALRFTVTSSGQ